MKKKTIVCYGDSNTWGWCPKGYRYDYDQRWTTILQNQLGDEYYVVNEGLGGRTSVYDVPTNEYWNGLKGLGFTLLTNAPIDLVVCMVGSNDLHNHHSFQYYKGLRKIAYNLKYADIIYPCPGLVYSQTEGPKVLLVSPILVDECYHLKGETSMGEKWVESKDFARYTEKVAKEYDLPWMDASKFANPSKIDGLHMDPEDHYKLGVAIAEKVKTIL